MSTRARTQPIWTLPEPGTRRPRFTREQLAAAALAIADAEGFDAVSMRRVAAELGAGTMTLYHYVRNKDDLLALMDDAIMGELLVPDGELPSDWRAALTEIAVRTRAAFRRHPWSFEALRETEGGGPNGMRHLEQSVAAVSGLDLDAREQLEIVSMVDDYVFGYVMRENEALGMAGDVGEELLPDLRGFFEAQLATGDYPHIERLLGDQGVDEIWRVFTELTLDDDRFERGLRRLLDGIELDLERRRAS